MFKKLMLLFLMVFIFVPQVSQAKSKYLYRQRAEWVKLIKLSKKQMAGVALQHPYTELKVSDVEAMLLSLSMNKGSFFKKEDEERNLFSIEEAKKFAPYITKALAKAAPNQVVNVSVIHKRPRFIISNDYISIMNVYKTSEGLHVHFNKLFAKLNSDYKQASQMDEAIQRAKGLRVSLEAKPGQKLAYGDRDEVILDPQFDFSSTIDRKVPAQTNYKVTQTPTTNPAGNTADRLQELENLRAQKLITNQEYQKKRKEILEGI